MKQLLFLFLLIGLKSFSQSIELGNIDNIKKTFFVKGNEELYVFQKDSISIIDINKLEKISKKGINYPFDDFINRYFPVSTNSGIYFIEYHGGKVYRLDESNLIRIDNSYTHRMQMSSNLFTFNNIIYRYGGYGFWSMRDFFTYYYNTTNEWEIISPSGSKVKPRGTQSSIIDIKDETFYVYGGLTLNPFEPNDFIPNKEVWKFNLPTKSWNLLGKNNIDFNEYNFNFSYGNKHIFYNGEGEDLIVVDAVSNTIQRYKKLKYQYSLNTSQKSFYNKGIFYCILKTYSTGNVNLTKIKEDEFFGELVDKKKLYYNNERIYYSVGIIFLFGILILIVLQVKKYLEKLNMIVLSNNRLIYKRNILSFDIKSIRIIILLLESNDNVPSNDILNIVENKELNHGHNTRVKNNLVEEINLKLKSVLGIENDLITSNKSDMDKRIKIYHIDKSYFHIK